MKLQWSAELSECENLMRAANAAAVRKKLESIKTDEVPREFIVPYARLARRANAPLLALKALKPIVRPQPGLKVSARSPEKAEYGASLLRIGALHEAKKLFLEVNEREAPDVLLFQAFLLFRQWRYGEAIPFLEKYLKHPKIDAYQKLVAKTNLACSLIFVREDQKAMPLLEELLRATKENRHWLLYGNALEYLAQAQIAQKNWKAALKHLEESRKRLVGSGTLDELFVNKWEAIAGLLEKPKSSDALLRLRLVRNQAEEMNHWETLRSCDQYHAIALQDLKLFEHVYAGTPYPAFRKKLLSHFESSVRWPILHDWTPGHFPGDRFETPSKTIEVKDPGVKVSGMKPGQLLQRLLVALTRDFYQPPRIPTLYSVLFPDAYYDPKTSPARVHQALKRLRQVIEQENWPMELREDERAYRLISPGGIALQVETSEAEKDSPGDLKTHRIRTLKDHFEGREFSAQEAAEALSISTREFQRLALESPEFLRFGKARATRYRMP